MKLIPNKTVNNGKMWYLFINNFLKMLLTKSIEKILKKHNMRGGNGGIFCRRTIQNFSIILPNQARWRITT